MLVSRGSRGIALATCALLLLGSAACGGGEEVEEPASSKVRLYGSDGNMLNSFAKAFKEQTGLLDGMKGTTPLTPLSQDFRDRMLGIDPKLSDFLYSGETYDAVVITALASQLAGSTAPSEIAKQIIGVTNRGQRCDTVDHCLDLAREGIDIEYRGVSLTRGGFTPSGEPAAATYATLHFGKSDQLDNGKTEFLGAGDHSSASTTAPPPPKKASEAVNRRSGAPLKLGELLPRSGDLVLGYPPMGAAVRLAVKEINEAGGVLGKPVELRTGDDGTNPAVAKATVARHVADGVHVLIGAGASGISRAVLPDVIAAGLILFSPSNTDAGLTSIDDKGLYFRTAPSDLLQGRALADMILRDGPDRIALVARKDSYGEGLQTNVQQELERAGHGGSQVKLFTYVPPETPDAPPVDFSSGAKEIKQFGADAVLIIGFAESAQVIEALADVGLEFQR